jgi:hypothetical protein
VSKLLVRNYYPATLPLDGEEIKIRVHRMSATEFREWARAHDRVVDPSSERSLTIRDPNREDEIAKRLVPRAWTDAETAAAEAIATLEAFIEIDVRMAASIAALKALIPAEPGDEVFVMTDAAVRKRRLDEMTSEARAAWDVVDARDEAFERDFIINTITHYVTVEKGEIDQEVDGAVVPLTEGADLVRFFGGHATALRHLVGAVREENTLSTALKNALRSARASRPSSGAAGLDPLGATPAPPAPPVESEDSAAIEAATASTADAPSGSTVSSS